MGAGDSIGEFKMFGFNLRYLFNINT